MRDLMLQLVWVPVGLLAAVAGFVVTVIMDYTERAVRAFRKAYLYYYIDGLNIMEERRGKK